VDISFTVCLFFFVCLHGYGFFRREQRRRQILHGGSLASCAGNLPCWGTLLPRSKPKIGRIGQPPGSKVNYVKAHRKRHARNAPFAEYGAKCGRRSTCVDIGQPPESRSPFSNSVSQGPLTYLFYLKFPGARRRTLTVVLPPSAVACFNSPHEYTPINKYRIRP